MIGIVMSIGHRIVVLDRDDLHAIEIEWNLSGRGRGCKCSIVIGFGCIIETMDHGSGFCAQY
jgi:hypothetical protein